MNRQFHATLFAVAALAVATPVFAGPPLLCHPFDIAGARSLPWSGVDSWYQGDPTYRVQNVVADAEALLTPDTPVVVRMETMRRAALYASTDRAVAATLLQRFVARAETLGADGKPDALRLLDAAYVAGAYRQIAMLDGMTGFKDRAAAVHAALGRVDGAALIARSVAARPDDPTIRFAAALIVADVDRGAYAAHASKARAGVTRDALLARNIKQVS